MIYFFNPNKWNKHFFLSMVIAIQFAMWGSIGLDYMNYNIPLLRQVIGFLYLTFIPGFVSLRCLDIRKIDSVNYILYSVGLSITILMLLGFILNSLNNFIGLTEPLAPINLIISISAFILILTLYIFKYEAEEIQSVDLNFINKYSSKLLVFFIPLLLSIIGSWYANSYHNGILLILFATSIPFFVLLVFSLKDRGYNGYYPLIIYIMSLALLLHYSLISWFIFGYDVHYEYHIFENVITNLFWNSANPVNNVNAMLSVTILPTFYYYVLNIDATWVFKIIYQLIFAFVPVVLYQIYKQNTKDKFIAFLSIFFFISNITFFTEMTMLARQEIAELFFVLVILVATDKYINHVKGKLLIILFSFSIAVSHYGLSYIYLFYLSIILLVIISINLEIIKNIIPKTCNVFNYNFYALFFVITIAWYLNTSNSSTFNSIIHLLSNMVETMTTEFFSPTARDSVILTAIGNNPVGISKMHLIHIYLKRFTLLFIVIGFIEYIYKSIIKTDKISNDVYLMFSILSMALLFVAVILPSISNSWNMTRLYHISLLILAPFAISGCLSISSFFMKLLKFKPKSSNIIYLLTTLFFILFFIFEISLVSVYAGEPASAALDMGSQDIVPLNGALTHEQEIYSAKWLSHNRKIENRIYADSIANKHVLVSYGAIYNNYYYLAANEKIPHDSYIYLRYINVIYNIVPSYDVGWKTETLSNISYIHGGHRVYSNDGSEILLS